MKCKFLFAIIFFALVITACQPAEESAKSSPATVTSTQSDEAAVRKVFNQYEEKWNAADLDGVMTFIADDVVQMPPGRPASIGKEALRSDFGKVLSEYISDWRPSIEDIEVSGDIAILRRSGSESWTPKSGGETITYYGKAINVFRRGADGSWKITLEIWNSNKPNE